MLRGKSTVLYLIVGLAILVAGVWAYAGTVFTGLSPGQPMPDFVLHDLDGQQITLADLLGQPLVFRLSSVGCSQCSQDFQWLEGLAQAHPHLVVVAVQVEDDAPGIRRVLGAGYEPSYEILLDVQGDLAQALGLRWLPAAYFIDADGVLAGSIWGEAQQHLIEVDHFIEQISPAPADGEG